MFPNFGYPKEREDVFGVKLPLLAKNILLVRKIIAYWKEKNAVSVNFTRNKTIFLIQSESIILFTVSLSFL